MSNAGPVSYAGEFPTPDEATLAWQGASFEERLIERDSAGRIKREVMTKLEASAHVTERLFQAMVSAVKMGNLDIALMIFAGMEAKEVSAMGQLLVKNMQSLQEKRRGLSQQMGNLPNDAAGSRQLATLQQQMNEVEGDMGIYQQILKDLLQQKREALELANSVSQSEHQTTMSIARR
jgi:hypothetical protein